MKKVINSKKVDGYEILNKYLNENNINYEDNIEELLEYYTNTLIKYKKWLKDDKKRHRNYVIENCLLSLFVGTILGSITLGLNKLVNHLFNSNDHGLSYILLTLIGIGIAKSYNEGTKYSRNDIKNDKIKIREAKKAIKELDKSKQLII